MIGEILKTEVVGEENRAYTINCLLDNFISSIDCSIAIDDEFGITQGTDEIDKRNEWKIRDDENNINWFNHEAIIFKFAVQIICQFPFTHL